MPQNAPRDVGNLYQGYSPYGGTPYDVFAKDPGNILRNGNVSTWLNPNPQPKFSIRFIPDRSQSESAYASAAEPLAMAMAEGRQPTPEQSGKMRDFWMDASNYGRHGIVDGAPPLVMAADGSTGIGVSGMQEAFDPVKALQQMLGQASPKGRIVMSGNLTPEARQLGIMARDQLDQGKGEQETKLEVIKALHSIDQSRQEVELRKKEVDIARATAFARLHEIDPLAAQQFVEQMPATWGQPHDEAETFVDKARKAKAIMSNPVLETLGFTPESTAQQIGDTILQRLDGEQAIDDSAIPAIQQYLQIQAMRNPKFLSAKDNSLQARLAREILGAKETKGTVERLRKSKASEADQKKREGEITLENLAKPVRTLGDALMAPRRVYSPFGP